MSPLHVAASSEDTILTLVKGEHPVDLVAIKATHVADHDLLVLLVDGHRSHQLDEANVEVGIVALTEYQGITKVGEGLDHNC